MASEQAAAMLEQLHSTCQALARMQQELANQTSASRQQHQETMQQALTNAQNTHDTAQQLRTNKQVGPVEIQGTFHQAVYHKFPTFRSKYMTIANGSKKLMNAQHYTISRNPTK